VQSNEDFVKKIRENGSNYAKITIYRNNTQFDVEVEPQKAKDSGDYKIGTWVRDSAAGIGTLTFYRKDNNKFAALGHSIIDNDIGEKYNVENGCIEQARVSSVVKGEKGYPGELKGIFANDETVLGNVEGNSINGIYGTIENPKDEKAIKVASRWNIKEGPATIICTIQSDKTESYDIDIQKIMYNSGNSSKSMIIKITDERLLDITGGIVQGMSGSPIIQNDK
jgi:stage IV sporulation protein B